MPGQTPRTSWQPVDLVMTLDDQDRAGARTHRHGVRRGTVGAVLQAGHVGAAGDPGGAEEDVLPTDEVPGVQDRVDVVPGVERPSARVGVAWPQSGLDRAAHTGQCGGREDAFVCAADADEHVAVAVGV